MNGRVADAAAGKRKGCGREEDDAAEAAESRATEPTESDEGAQD